MIGTINYTNRVQLTRHNLIVTVRENEGVKFFDAQVRSLPPQILERHSDANVYVEAYDRSTAAYMRFNYGTVGKITPPTDRQLTSFSGDLVKFGLKIVGHGTRNGLIVAEVDGINPSLGALTGLDSRLPILHVEYTNLGNRIWNLYLPDSPSDTPILQITDQIAGVNLKEKVKTDPYFTSLVYPAVVKEILVRILIMERDTFDQDDPQDYRSLWLEFIKKFHTDELPSDLNQSEEQNEVFYMWIDNAVDAFCRKRDLLGQLQSALIDGGNE